MLKLKDIKDLLYGDIYVRIVGVDGYTKLSKVADEWMDYEVNSIQPGYGETIDVGIKPPTMKE